MSTTTGQPLRPAPPLVCSCGQELDLCTRDHCPRCGRELVHPTPRTAAPTAD